MTLEKLNYNELDDHNKNRMKCYDNYENLQIYKYTSSTSSPGNCTIGPLIRCKKCNYETIRTSRMKEHLKSKKHQKNYSKEKINRQLERISLPYIRFQKIYCREK